jgi:hypothetical protein
MSLEKDATEIRKLIENGYKTLVDTETQTETETEPATTPVVKPEAPTTPKPSKPSTPIRQKPGVHPKPKAVMNADVELFLRKRNLLGNAGNTGNRMVEAEVPQEKPGKPEKEYDIDVVPQEKQAWIQTGDEVLNKILPGLPQEQRDYLIKISSDSYTELVDRIEEFTGITINKQNVPQLVGIVIKALEEVKAIEGRNRQAFEEMALQLVFSVPEFKIVEQAYLNDEISFDIKIGPAELEKLTNPETAEEKSEQEDLKGLSQDEELNLKMAELLQNSSDDDIRRRFSNLMTSGGAVGKLYLFNMISDKLKKMDSRLPALYGVLSSLVHLGYWITPMGIERIAASREDMSMGSEEVVPEGERYVIKARGVVFPYLVHEITKGIYEYLSLDPSLENEMSKETVEDETVDFMAGPGIHREIVSYINPGEQELLPLVQKKLVAMGPAEIRDVLAKNDRGHEIMNNLIQQARDEWSGYKKQRNDYDNTF